MPWGAIASIGGALIGAGAISDASSAQSGATQAGTEEQRRQFDIAQRKQAPFLTAGTGAVQSLSDLLGIKRQFDPQANAADAYLQANPDVAASGRYGSDPYQHFLDWGQKEGRVWPTTTNPAATEVPSDFGALNRKFTLEDFWADPVTKASYQAGLDLGTQSLKNMAGARGNLNSGATLKDLTRFATDYTGQQAAGSQQRFVGDQTNIYNRLAGVAGTGQTAATQTGNAAMATGGNIANMLTAQGNARGAAAIAQGNLFGGAAQNIGNWWQQNQILNRLYPQNSMADDLAGAPNYYSGVAGGYG